MNGLVIRNTLLWLAPAFLLSFFAIGWPYWQIPYARVSLPNTLISPGLVLVGVIATAVRAFGRVHFLAVLLVLAAAAPAAVMIRVIVETSEDSTSHNLWPLEVILAGFVGLVGSLAGTLLGSIPTLLSRKTRQP